MKVMLFYHDKLVKEIYENHHVTSIGATIRLHVFHKRLYNIHYTHFITCFDIYMLYILFTFDKS